MANPTDITPTEDIEELDQATNTALKSGFLQDCINACLESANAPKLTIHQIDSNGKALTQDERSNIHVLIQQPFGTGKSSIIDDMFIRAQKSILRTSSHTLAGFLGTISQEDNTFIPGDAIRGAGKTIVIDEGQALPDNFRDTLKSLLEDQWASRTMGVFLKDKSQRGQYYTVKSHKTGNGFNITAQFSLLAFSEDIPPWFEQAFISRFITIRRTITLDDLPKISRGDRDVQLELPPRRKEDKKARTHLYRYMNNIHKPYSEFLQQMPIVKQFSDKHLGYLLRTYMTLARLSAYWVRKGKTEEEAAENALSYTAPILYGYIRNTHFNADEIRSFDAITQGCHTMLQVQGATNISEYRLKVIIAKLQQYGMIDFKD